MRSVRFINLAEDGLTVNIRDIVSIEDRADLRPDRPVRLTLRSGIRFYLKTPREEVTDRMVAAFAHPYAYPTEAGK